MNESKETAAVSPQRPHRIAPPRSTKLQICLTADERVQLTERARAAGFDSVSSYVRAQTLGPAGQGQAPWTRALWARRANDGATQGGHRRA